MHGVWSPGRGLCLWAEDPDRSTVSTSRARRGARPHPFAVDTGTLADTAPAGSTPGQAVLLLPSGPDGPRDSPQLTRDEEGDARHTTVLGAWTVPVVELGPDAAIALLERPPEPGEGASLTVLRGLAGFAGDLVTRGRVLPRPGDQPGWRPVLQGADLVAADAFAAALPPVVRSESPSADAEGAPDAVEVVREALGEWVDAHARRRLGACPDLPDADRAALAVLADPGHRAALDAGLARWEVVGAPHAGPARATFRLTEVVLDDLGHAVEGEPRWWLEFSLQSVQDPSLRVTAASVWRDPSALRRWLDDPSELLFTELGRAARLYPELADALRVPRPTGMDLDAAGTHHFLSAVAADLDRAGFGVLLPAWWTERAGARLGLSASAAAPAGPEGVVVTASRLGRDDLVAFSWRLALDGEALDDAEMAALVEAKAPLVRLRGQWVAVDADRLRAGLDFLARHRSGTRTVGDVLHLAVSHPDDRAELREVGLPVEGISAAGPLGALLAGRAERAIELLATPDGVDATLRPYQRRGLSWLAFLAGLGVGGVLADDMGLGKTLQLLALEAHERAGTADPRPTLLVCPTSVIGTWEREAARFVPALRIRTHHGPGRDRDAFATRAGGTDLVLTSYGTLTRDVDAVAEVSFRRLVLDEAQLVKNSRSRAARAVRRVDATHRVALTGTPVENRLAELWSVMDAVNPGLLGTVGEFRDRYAVPVERHGRTDVAARLRTVTRPFLLRRLKTDPGVADDLPEKIETVERCALGAEQASLYQVVVDDMLEKLETLPDGVERRGRVLAAMTKLKQVCNHPALLLHERSSSGGAAFGRRSGKIARLEEILAEILATGERALLFTQFAEFGDMLAPHLAARFDTEVAWLHGGTSRRARDRMVESFQGAGPEGSSAGPRLFLLSLKAGGTGLTLTNAQHVVHLDRWWNPAVEDQATDRAFRIGQRRTVTVRKLVGAGTLEERIDELIASKRTLANMVVGTTGDDADWLTGLSPDELRRVIALDPDAVEDPEDLDGA